MCRVVVTTPIMHCAYTSVMCSQFCLAHWGTLTGQVRVHVYDRAENGQRVYKWMDFDASLPSAERLVQGSAPVTALYCHTIIPYT